MVKSELIEQLAEHCATAPRPKIKAAVEALGAQMSEALAAMRCTSSRAKRRAPG